MSAKSAPIAPGTVVGVLTILGVADVRGPQASDCQCKCGKRCVRRNFDLRRGSVISCGCRKNHHTGKNPRARAVYNRLYAKWRMMLRRCTNPDDQAYHNYGARGIQVCARWQDFETYQRDILALGPQPSPSHSIDRINNDGNYEPGNVRWASRSVQGSNKRCAVNVTWSGKTQNVDKWASELGFPAKLLYRRLASGWPVEKAFTETPKRATKPRRNLTPDEVREIRRKYAAGATSMRALAREYDITFAPVQRLLSGKGWRHVQ